jgi:enoyl-CoA hydratase
MQVVSETSEGIATITLDAPERRNALDGAMAVACADAVRAAEDDPDVGAIVVTGRAPAFCAGAVREVLARAGDPADEDARRELDAIYDLFLVLGSAAVPTIAAVNGAAVGAGLNLALAADVCVAASDATLISGFARIGLHPGGGHLHLLRRRSGATTAAAMGLLDQSVDGRRAVEVGLAWAHAPVEELPQLARELAKAPAANPALARLTTRTLRRNAADGWTAHVEAERGAQLLTLLARAR